jgi:uncharacterized membrane protein YagU involved in acid resistance
MRTVGLVVAHRVLIAVAIALGVVLAAFGVRGFAQGNDPVALATAVFGAVACLSFAIYLRWFVRKGLPLSPGPAPAEEAEEAQVPAERPALGLYAAAGMLAGAISGVVLVAATLLGAVLAGVSGEGIVRGMAAAVLGPEAIAGSLLAALAVSGSVHMTLSLVMGLVFGLAGRTWTLGVSLAVGAVFGPLVYALMIYFFIPLISPEVLRAGTNHVVAVLCHLVFGLALGWVYVRLRDRSAPEAKA